MKSPFVTTLLTELKVVGIVSVNAPPNAGRDNDIVCVLFTDADPVIVVAIDAVNAVPVSVQVACNT